MGLFERIKKVFAGSAVPGGDSGLYFYVKLDVSGEIVRLRIDPAHELNPDYDRGGYITRKSIIGPQTFRRAEATFRFDEGRQLVDSEISGGELTTQEAWHAQEASSSEG